MPKCHITLLFLITAFIACKPTLNPNGVYHVYKVLNGKNTDPKADDALKQKYLDKPFSIAFSKGVVDISDAADLKPKVLHRVNGRNGIVSYTPGGYDPIYNDNSTVRMELHTSPSDTILFINDRSFLSAQSASSGKIGGMIICYLGKTKR